MWHLNVPKCCHIYWGGGKMVYLRYLTVTTFMKLNPDWKIILWYPKVSFHGKSWGIESGCQELNERLFKDYFPDLLDLPIIKMSVDFKGLGFRDNFAEVHKNDYIRISVLNHYGGVWSDLDILYFKPITELKVNVPENKNIENYVCISPDYGHSTGFNMASEGNQFYGKLVDFLPLEYHHKNYQCWGPDIFNKYFKHLNSMPSTINLDMDVVYAHDCHRVSELLINSTPRFTEGSIGCHWYGGNSLWGKFLNDTHGGFDNLTDNLISKLIKDAKL